MASILCLLKKRTCEIPGKIQGPWKKIKWLFTITCLGPRQLGPRWQSGSGWSGWPCSPSRGASWTVTRRRCRNCYPRLSCRAMAWATFFTSSSSGSWHSWGFARGSWPPHPLWPGAVGFWWLHPNQHLLLPQPSWGCRHQQVPGSKNFLDWV